MYGKNYFKISTDFYIRVVAVLHRPPAPNPTMTTQQNKQKETEFMEFLVKTKHLIISDDFEATVMDLFTQNISTGAFKVGHNMPWEAKEFVKMFFNRAMEQFYDERGIELYETEMLKDEIGNVMQYTARDELGKDEKWRPSRKWNVRETEAMMGRLADVFDLATNCMNDRFKLKGGWKHEWVEYVFEVPEVEEVAHFSPRSPEFNMEESERNRLEVVRERARTRFDGSMG